jgi:hypothetical protein
VLALYAPAIHLYSFVQRLCSETFSVKFCIPSIPIPCWLFRCLSWWGNMMSTSGISVRIFNFANSLVGKLHGGLAQVNNWPA